MPKCDYQYYRRSMCERLMDDIGLHYWTTRRGIRSSCQEPQPLIWDGQADPSHCRHHLEGKHCTTGERNQLERVSVKSACTFVCCSQVRKTKLMNLLRSTMLVLLVLIPAVVTTCSYFSLDRRDLLPRSKKATKGLKLCTTSYGRSTLTPGSKSITRTSPATTI